MTELVDAEVLEQLREIMEDDFGALLETFLIESEKQYLSAAQAWDEQNMDGLARSTRIYSAGAGPVPFAVGICRFTARPICQLSHRPGCGAFLRPGICRGQATGDGRA